MRTRGIDQLFVVRTWLEAPDDTRTMRGRIDHVASGTRRYFSNFGDLCDFIAAAQAAGPAGTPTGDADATGDARDRPE